MWREPFCVITITFRPLGVSPLEREDSHLALVEVRGRVGDATGDERGCHGGRETDALEGVALLYSVLAATAAVRRGPSSRFAGPMALDARSNRLLPPGAG